MPISRAEVERWRAESLRENGAEQPTLYEIVGVVRTPRGDEAAPHTIYAYEHDVAIVAIALLGCAECGLVERNIVARLGRRRVPVFVDNPLIHPSAWYRRHFGCELPELVRRVVHERPARLAQCLESVRPGTVDQRWWVEGIVGVMGIIADESSRRRARYEWDAAWQTQTFVHSRACELAIAVRQRQTFAPVVGDDARAEWIIS